LLNADLWQELDRVMAEHQISWEWVKGHAGNRYNELADELANEAIRKLSVFQAAGYPIQPKQLSVAALLPGSQ
jgi:ribonuclease HI